MVKWIKLTHNQFLGFFALGLAFFVLQEMPYIIMPLIPLKINPLMEMTDRSAILNAAEKTLGISCIIVLLFLVRGDSKWFSLRGAREIAPFCAAMLAIAGYFMGWAFYFNGCQSLPLMLCTLVALPPIYYSFIGLWRGNYVLAALGGLFLVAHFTNVWYNLR
jgi:hypothetical protein